MHSRPGDGGIHHSRNSNTYINEEVGEHIKYPANRLLLSQDIITSQLSQRPARRAVGSTTRAPGGDGLQSSQCEADAEVRHSSAKVSTHPAQEDQAVQNVGLSLLQNFILLMARKTSDDWGNATLFALPTFTVGVIFCVCPITTK